jgi:hypothetical protein
MQLQEGLQDALTDELLGMSAQLKQNVAGMRDAIEQRGDLLGAADAALDDSHAKAQRSAARAKEQYQRWARAGAGAGAGAGEAAGALCWASGGAGPCSCRPAAASRCQPAAAAGRAPPGRC